ncbi:homoserine O-acetyltransferase [Micrococcales bacterium 31B]|nr:homoserine O-acetyltransferase [Micrococcales bacterium 31B]
MTSGNVASAYAGGWRDGDPVGDRKFAPLGGIELENGEALDVTMAYETWGTLNADRSNAILVLHALTGDSHVFGPAGEGHPTAGWWEDLVGPGRAIDTNNYFVVAPNILGGCQGSTGPSSLAADGRPYGSRFPLITTRDQVRAEHGLQEALGLGHWALVIGGSMGGMRAIEWAVMYPQEVDRVAVIASTARVSADQVAWSSPQIHAILGDPYFANGDYYENPLGPENGLGIARRIAHVTYRSAYELEERFSNRPQDNENPYAGTLQQPGRFAIESYLDHHADKLVKRFDPNSYLSLVRAMNSHDVGRQRGGYEAALARVTARALVVAVDSDRLFPVGQSEELAAALSNAAPLQVIESPYGHDGFLIESGRVAHWVDELLRSS